MTRVCATKFRILALMQSKYSSSLRFLLPATAPEVDRVCSVAGECTGEGPKHNEMFMQELFHDILMPSFIVVFYPWHTSYRPSSTKSGFGLNFINFLPFSGNKITTVIRKRDSAYNSTRWLNKSIAFLNFKGQ